MSLAKSVASVPKEKKGIQRKNMEIALKLMQARQSKKEAFPSTDIPSLVEMALLVVADNIEEYPSLDGVTDENVKKSIIKCIDVDLPLTITAKNVEFEFYWQKKCGALLNCKKEDHGGSFKQAFIERRI